MTTPTRPSFIDVRSESQASIPRPLRSPRLHVAGEHPPELSPLDAFALQSRLLAKQLEESARAGRRMSRLPPLTTESPLIVQGRSDYFRSMSLESGSDAGDIPQQHSAGPAMRPEVEESPERPKSLHPRMSHIPPTPDTSIPMPTSETLEQYRGRDLEGAGDRSSYFGLRREHSPSSFDSASIDARLADDAGSVHQQEQQQEHQNELLSEPPMAGQALQSPRRLAHKASHESLAPPTTTFPKRTSSIKSQPVGGPEDDVMGSSFHSTRSRKLSSSSTGVFSPYRRRSPSVSSNMSELPRPAFNFSRPMSRAGTPSLDTPGRMDQPTRQPSSDSHSSLFLVDDTANTPVSINSESFPDMQEDPNSGAPSYIYSKYSLPRGKLVHRSNTKERGVPPSANFQWEQPMVPPSNVQTMPYAGQAPPSPPTRPSSSGDRDVRRPSEEASLDVPRPTMQPSLNNGPPSAGHERASEDGQRGRCQSRPSTATAAPSDASTIKAQSQQSTAATMADTPADEHVNKAVALHEEGKLNESTYHLRYAAKQGHPTGMLLYALACRHGWGMRPNQPEAVSWLRKAAECAGVEIAEDEHSVKEGQHVDVIGRKTRKAQLALSIYELGVSHMNGWGIEQDKALALRCFEIAGSESHEQVFDPFRYS